jgi:hypothetical protein
MDWDQFSSSLLGPVVPARKRVSSPWVSRLIFRIALHSDIRKSLRCVGWSTSRRSRVLVAFSLFV